jgi:hypothetical protein
MDTADGEGEVELAFADGELGGAGDVVEGVGGHGVVVCVVGAACSQYGGFRDWKGYLKDRG